MTNPVTEEELIKRNNGKRVTKEALENNIKSEKFYVHEGGTLTICVLTLQNGFTITGQSACADPNNYKQDIGERLSREDAKNKIWAFMGYSLREELYQQEIAGKGGTFLDRMINERNELRNKLDKLISFIDGNVQFIALDPYDQNLLLDQRTAMEKYWHVLEERISRS